MNGQTVVIRPYDGAADTRKLSQIWLDASEKAHFFLGRPRLLEQRRLIEEKYLPGAETWVACQGGEPVGFISLVDDFVGWIFVAPDRQGLGIGRRLIAHALDRKGALSLEVYTRNAQALRFYGSLGFREISRRPTDDAGLPFENAHLRLNG